MQNNLVWEPEISGANIASRRFFGHNFNADKNLGGQNKKGESFRNS
jgi:hypothetical protein